jgi:5-methylcytosine-specific restriction enzyme subunit McrC
LNKLDVFEYGRLIIDDVLFTKEHWKSFVKLNEANQNAYFDVLYNGIRFKQFVGVIQVDGLLVHIHPKADKDDSGEKWKDVLIQMLKATGRLKAQPVGDAQLKKQHLNLLEVYFEYFLRELELLIHRGLIKKYRKETGNVKSLKGKLEFYGNIRHNLVHKERFYTTHQVYDVNHKLHQVLQIALSIIDQFSKGSRIADYCKRISMSFPEMDSISVNSQVLSSIKIDRKTAPYERAFELAKLIILNYSPDINHGNQKMIALLFDMNELWEEYVLVQLKREVNNENSPFYKQFTIQGQTRKYIWNSNFIQPDIEIVSTTTNETFIIDTKWKRPGYSASVEDLRQIYTYARFWDAKTVMLLYPGDEVQNRKGTFKTDDYSQNTLLPTAVQQIEHMGKMGFISVFDSEKANKLNTQLGAVVLEFLFD